MKKKTAKRSVTDVGRMNITSVSINNGVVLDKEDESHLELSKKYFQF